MNKQLCKIIIEWTNLISDDATSTTIYCPYNLVIAIISSLQLTIIKNLYIEEV